MRVGAADHSELERVDARRRPLPGYGAVDCVPVHDDGVRQAVRWTGTRSLPTDRAVRIRFRIKNTYLYSYTVE